MSFDYGFGRIPSPEDPRDYRMAAAVAALEKLPLKPRRWHSDRVLNQGRTPHCVGFSWAAWGIATPVEDPWGNPVGHDIYYRAKTLDGEPGAENGSTVRSGARVLRAMGRVGTYYFASSVDEACDYVSRFGPVVFGTIWTQQMVRPSLVRAFITPRGKVVGGHAWLAIGVERENVIIRNSWGPDWGAGGDARIRISDLKAIFREGGEACAATELPLAIGGV